MATFIVKCIERCNSNCVYCEVARNRADTPDMTLDTLELLFMRIDEYLSQRKDEHVLFTWHGGEPLLLGAEYLETARRMQAKHCSRTGDRIAHCIQSNLTLLDETHIAVLKRMGITHVGSSYDPEPNMRGPGGHAGSKAYNTAFLRGTTLLDRHNMSWGVIYVVTRKALADPKAIFIMLTNLLVGRSLMLNPVVVSNPAHLQYAITPEEYADFLGTLFPLWFAHRERYPDVEPFAGYLETLTGGKQRLFCSEAGNCAHTHLNIGPSGRVSKCGRASDLGIMELGAIQESSIGELFQRSVDLFGGRTEMLRNGECRGCSLFSDCHGGCPIDSYAAHGRFDRKSGWCEAKKKFVRDYFEPVVGTGI
jgi:uncharacterized protein